MHLFPQNLIPPFTTFSFSFSLILVIAVSPPFPDPRHFPLLWASFTPKMTTSPKSSPCLFWSASILSATSLGLLQSFFLFPYSVTLFFRRNFSPSTSSQNESLYTVWFSSLFCSPLSSFSFVLICTPAFQFFLYNDPFPSFSCASSIESAPFSRPFPFLDTIFVGRTLCPTP